MRWEGNELILEKPGTAADYISVDNRDYFLDKLQDGGEGGNSFVFKLIDPNGEAVARAIKICKFYEPAGNTRWQQRIDRFDREIQMMKLANGADVGKFIVTMYFNGVWRDKKKRAFRYYVMDLANYDLGKYLVQTAIAFPEKIRLCMELASAVKALHDMGIYHRDLKPENILFIGNRWKIGDLGLSEKRDEDMSLDEPKEKIGPFGYHSPEAVNKALGNRELEEFDYDCKIDDRSDVFQLAKIFWFIMQGEVPVGQLVRNDFKISDDHGFMDAIVVPALQYSKSRRPAIDRLQSSFVPICQAVGVL